MGITRKMDENRVFFPFSNNGKNKKISPHKTGGVHRDRGQIDHRFTRLLPLSLVHPPAIPSFPFPELPFDRIP